MTVSAAQWLDRIRALCLPRRMKIMNVCGGHERSIAMAGLRGALPGNIELIPGPGCPVCVCPEEDISHAIQIALGRGVILAAFGDLLRVPVNAPKGAVRSLEEAKASGADVRPVASPREAAVMARKNPEKTVVFFAAGFETTIAPVAAMLAQESPLPVNLSILLSGRLTRPAVAMLLESGETGFDALIAPGHVATVMGPEEWLSLSEKHRLPSAVAGFMPESLLAAIYSTLRQLLEGKCFLDNCYPELVRPGGNAVAKKLLAQTLDVADANWRGVGVIPDSGFDLKPSFAAHDARRLFPPDESARCRSGKMPPGCDCAKVVLGRIRPDECKLYGLACTPRDPVGPCMVSEEGACRIWWAAGMRSAHAIAGLT